MRLYHNVARQLVPFVQLSEAMKTGNTPVLTVGLSEIHKSHFLYSLSKELEQPVLVITEDEASARRMCDDINVMHGGKEAAAFLYPARDFTFRQVETASKEYEQIRIGVLSRLISGNCPICFASVEALLQRTIPPQELTGRTFQITADGSYQLEDMAAKLVRAGYVRRPQVEGIAQFALRGGILDLFPPGETAPVRIEFWGDEVDTLSYFDLETQRRTEPLSSLTVTPACECLFDSADVLRRRIEALLKKTKGLAAQTLQRDLERLESQGELLSADKYLPLAYEACATLLDYCGDHAVVLSEYTAVKERAKSFSWQMAEDLKALFEDGELCKGLDCYHREFAPAVEEMRGHPLAVMDTFARGSSDIPYHGIISINPIQTSNFSGELKILYEDLYPLMESGYCVAILAGTEKAGMTLAKDLQQMGLNAEYSHDLKSISYRKITVLAGTVSSGFEYPEFQRGAENPVRGSVSSDGIRVLRGDPSRDGKSGDDAGEGSSADGIERGVQPGFEIDHLSKDHRVGGDGFFRF